MKKEIYLAGGCFWGTEKYLSFINGVLETEVGYANGNTENPTYEEVCHNDTNHAETVKIIYNDQIISLESLLNLFYEIIEPTTLNRQGGDTGTQYRTGIYFVDNSDEEIIISSINELQKKYDSKILVEVKPLKNYYKAEEYHQKYLDKNPGGYCHINPLKFEEVKKISLEERKKSLSKTQYEVTQNAATEPPFQNEYFNNFEKGIYVDIVSGEPLFISTDKFESGCGWPSFSKPIKNDLLELKKDMSIGMSRIEVRSRVSESHLGHVFDDGPKEFGGLRFCINSASLKFIPYEKLDEEGLSELKELF